MCVVVVVVASAAVAGELFCSTLERNGPREMSSKTTSRESCHLQLATASTSEVAPLTQSASHLRAALEAERGVEEEKSSAIEIENDSKRSK